MFTLIATLAVRTGGDAVLGDIERRFPFAACKQIEQDIPIWENTIYRDRPQLACGENTIAEFRACAWQSCEEAFA
jgi:hypothetical protein